MSTKLGKAVQKRIMFNKLRNRLVPMLFVGLTLVGWFEAAVAGMVFAAIQLSVLVRNARLDAIETQIGTVPIVEFRTGAQPADCATASSGTLLAQSALPSDWLAAAAAGSKAKSGTWTITGLATGAIGYFRIFDSQSPSTCHLQGSVTATGGGGDMTVDNVNIANAQVCTVNSFTLTDANA